jgi:hypothetical protein
MEFSNSLRLSESATPPTTEKDEKHNTSNSHSNSRKPLLVGVAFTRMLAYSGTD